MSSSPPSTFRLLTFDWHGTPTDSTRCVIACMEHCAHELDLEQGLKSTGLKDGFAAIRTSGETAAKPDPQMLFEIMEELGVASGETLVVGDAILQPGGLPRKCRGSAGMAPILIGVRKALGQRRRAPRRQWFGIPIKRS